MRDLPNVIRLLLAAGFVVACAPVRADLPLTGVTQLAAGGAHACAVMTDRRLKCWGANGSGQLGIGSLNDAYTAVNLGSLMAGAVSAGGAHTCALVFGGGGIRCWGRGTDGQLGNGQMLSTATSVQVVGLPAPAVALALGEAHTCAIVGGGALVCWGRNDDGQLGNGTTTGSSLPVAVAGLGAGVASIALGSFHGCALVAGGTVKCWGDNERGQLGNGATLDALTAADVVGLPPGVTAVASGGLHTCALTASGGVKCWGNNSGGELGNGTLVSSPTPVDVTGLASGVIGLAGGDGHTCALMAAGTVRCWGYNGEGQLGDGTTVSRSVPAEVSALAGATAVVAGNLFTCARLASGEVRCWGHNGRGQLGSGASLDEALVPADVRALTEGVLEVDLGRIHQCARTSAGGVRCWGNNIYGQLGDGTQVDSSQPVDVVGLGSGVQSVATGLFHTCAITAAGAAKCWGQNNYSQLGDGTSDDASQPVDVIGLSSDVASIAAGEYHTCARLQSGPIKCWGGNHWGQLGDGTQNHSTAPVDVAGLGAGVAALAAGPWFGCALTLAGGVKCWGANSSGQLGNGAIAFAQPTPVDVVGLASGVVAIAAGWSHACALRSTGTLACWGDSGALGNGTTTGSSVPVTVAGGDFTGVAAGVHTCAISNGGRLWCWGSNFRGQLGTGSRVDEPVPAGVVGLASGVAQVAVGATATCALTAAGGLKCWGENYSDMLGLGAGISALPVPVVTAECAGFTDLAAGSAFCVNLQWIRNRSITLGCNPEQYCTTAPVVRLGMAAFLDRLGDALAPVSLAKEEAAGALDPGADPVVCATLDLPAANHPRTATLDGVLATIATGELVAEVELVASIDAGSTWQGTGGSALRVTSDAIRWRNLKMQARFDIQAGDSVRFGLAVRRAGVSAATITDSTCRLLSRVANRNSSSAPFDPLR